jgi:acyl carrier protein
MTIKQDVRTFILESYLFTDDQSALADNDSFLGSGILDSTGMMELIYFLEEEYEVKVQDEEMVPENLDSVDRVVAYVERKRAAID